MCDSSNSEPTAIERANGEFKRGNKSAAIEILIFELRQNPDYISAWLILARMLDDPQKKLDCYRQVLARDPFNMEASAYLADHATPRTHTTVPAPAPMPAPAPAAAPASELPPGFTPIPARAPASQIPANPAPLPIPPYTPPPRAAVRPTATELKPQPAPPPAYVPGPQPQPEPAPVNVHVYSQVKTSARQNPLSEWFIFAGIAVALLLLILILAPRQNKIKEFANGLWKEENAAAGIEDQYRFMGYIFFFNDNQVMPGCDWSQRISSTYTFIDDKSLELDCDHNGLDYVLTIEEMNGSTAKGYMDQEGKPRKKLNFTLLTRNTSTGDLRKDVVGTWVVADPNFNPETNTAPVKSFGSPATYTYVEAGRWTFGDSTVSMDFYPGYTEEWDGVKSYSISENTISISGFMDENYHLFSLGSMLILTPTGSYPEVNVFILFREN